MSKYSVGLSFVFACALTIVLPGRTAAQPRIDALEPSPPVACTGNNDLAIIGKVIDTNGNGVVVRGNCDVLIRDSKIIAKQAGVLILANGDVEIEHSYVEGGQAGLGVLRDLGWRHGVSRLEA